MDGLENLMLRRRVEVIEAILERSGLVDSVLGSLHWHGDPPPDDIVRGGGLGGFRFPRPVPRPGDPPVWDFSRFSKAQLEGTLHSLAAERARLDAVETAVKEQLKNAK